MKILRVMGYPLKNTGSLERYMLGLSREIKQRGHEIHLLFDGPRNTELASFIHDLEQSYVLHWFPLPQEGRSIYIRKIFQLLKKEKYDIVHVYFEPAARLFGWIAYFLGVPVILRTIGSYPLLSETENPVITFLKKLNWKINHFPFKKIICVSKGIEDYIMKTFGQNKESTNVIYAAIDSNYFVPNGNLSMSEKTRHNNTIRLTFTGRLEKIKGVENFIKALHPLSKRYPNITACVVGDGSLKPALMDMIHEYELTSIVNLMGIRHDILEILHQTDIYVHPSYMEGCPASVLEAMSCGVPVVASDVGGIKEIVRNYIDGLLVPPGQPAMIEAAITKLIENEALYDKTRDNARKRVVEMFDFHVSIDREIELYQSLYFGGKV